MNNSVKNCYGEIVGFRCWTCGDVFPSMWGETCNKCRNQRDESRKMREEIAKLTLFELSGIGEENGDMWKMYVKGGKSVILKAALTYPEFNEKLLEP